MDTLKYELKTSVDREESLKKKNDTLQAAVDKAESALDDLAAKHTAHVDQQKKAAKEQEKRLQEVESNRSVLEQKHASAVESHASQLEEAQTALARETKKYEQALTKVRAPSLCA